MGGRTGIAWTDSTWNPVRGCSRVSEGCRHCYAERVAARFRNVGKPFHGFVRTQPNGEPQWTGRVELVPHMLEQPLRWEKPRRIFVNSMSDLFHEHLPNADIDRVFAVMALAGRHTFQVLTKRAERMRDYVRGLGSTAGAARLEAAAGALGWTLHFNDLEGMRRCLVPWPIRNVWLGVSVEDQDAANLRVPALLETPAAVRFLSAEPLLGPVSLRWAKWVSWTDANGERRTVNHLDGARGLHWVIIGGESGPRARPLQLRWIRSLADECAQADLRCFVKQLGSNCGDRGFEPGIRVVNDTAGPFQYRDRAGADPSEWPADLRIQDFPA